MKNTKFGYSEMPFYTPEDKEFYQWHAWTEQLKPGKKWWWFKTTIKW